MPKIPPRYQQYRQTAGNHTNWQDKKQGSQQDQDQRVQRLARQPGLHTGNVHRRNASLAMMQLLSVLSAAQISSANPAIIPQRADDLSTQNKTQYDGNYSRSQGTERPFRIRNQGWDRSSASAQKFMSADSLSPSASSGIGQAYQSPQSPVPSVSRDELDNYLPNKTFSALRQKRSIPLRKSVTREILDIRSDSRFDYNLRNKLDEIFRRAARTQEVTQAPIEDKNLITLLKCIQQMYLYIKNNNLPPTRNGQEIIDALLNIADSLDTPYEIEIVKTFKRYFDSERSTNRPISSPMPDIFQRMNLGGDRVVTPSEAQPSTMLIEQNNLVDEILTEALAVYGSVKDVIFSDAEKLSVIAAYLNQQIFGMSLDEWCVKQIRNLKSDNNSVFTNGYLGDCLYHAIMRPLNREVLSPQARAFHRNNVLNKLLPTLSLQLNAGESEELRTMEITLPWWGFVHAGAMLLRDSGAGLDGLRLADIQDVGISLHTMLTHKTVPPEYAGYFRLPALLYYAKTQANLPVSSKVSELNMQQVYRYYFDYISNWEKANNPLARLPDLIQGWQTRTGLARKKLTSHSVSEKWLSSYLNSHNEAQFETTKWVSLDLYDGTGVNQVKYAVTNGSVTLPNIDTVFDEQNRQLADTAYEVDKLLLPTVFDSLSEEEQRFIEQSQVDRVRIQFNALDSIKSVPLPPAARMGMAQADTLIYRIPDQIDLLQCTLNGEERIYALETYKNTGKYSLSRVDRDRQALLWLLDDPIVAMRDPDYKIRVTSHMTLKSYAETPLKLIENLAAHHRKQLLINLNEQGYDKTTQEKVIDFLLELVPFYTCITESLKGNERLAIPACMFDVVGLIPFAGQAAYTVTRFGTALTRSTAIALRYGALQASVLGMLKQTGKELIPLFPAIAQKISPQVVQGLGIGFLRSVDPGFELLASGGAKGIRAMGNVFAKIPNPSAGVARLTATLRKRTSSLSSFPDSTNLNFESLYSPEQGRWLDVALVGEEGGQAIWAEVNRETGKWFGEKFIRNGEGNLEAISVKLRHKNPKTSEVRAKPKEVPDKENPSGSGFKVFSASDIRSFEQAHSVRLTKFHMSDTSYILYYIKAADNTLGSEVLVVSAHGGFMDSDAAAPVVVLPSDITIQMLTPHGTMLNNPKLENILNAGKSLKAYLTITNGEVTHVDFLPQEGHPKWLYSENYDPHDIHNTLGREEGLQNYRHIRYERESDLYIAQVLIKNFELAKKSEATLTDVITVNTEISSIEDASLEKASVQRILDLDRSGKLLNAKGERYKTIAFCHCRCSLQQPLESISLYFMLPEQLENYAKKTAPKGSSTSEVKMTVLYRGEVNKEFEIKHYTVGRFMFIPIQQTIPATMRPTDFAQPGRPPRQPFRLE